MTAVAVALPTCSICGRDLEANGACRICDSEFGPAVTGAPVVVAPELSLVAIELRFHSGMITPWDIRWLISELKCRPTVSETISMLREAEEEFDRLTSPNFLVGGVQGV